VHTKTRRRYVGPQDTAGKLSAFAQGASGLFVGDEVVKAMLATSTFEQMKISSYEILETAANVVGDGDTESVCKECRREEMQMADWIEENLKPLTIAYLNREEAPGVTAKH
jgi:ferritin-like metal-binding protein YciE